MRFLQAKMLRGDEVIQIDANIIKYMQITIIDAQWFCVPTVSVWTAKQSLLADAWVIDNIWTLLWAAVRILWCCMNHCRGLRNQTFRIRFVFRFNVQQMDWWWLMISCFVDCKSWEGREGHVAWPNATRIVCCACSPCFACSNCALALHPAPL